MTSDLVHSPRQAGYLLPPAFQRSCLELDLLATYRNWWDLALETRSGRGDDHAEIRRELFAVRHRLRAHYAALGWPPLWLSELLRGAIHGMPFRTPERAA